MATIAENIMFMAICKLKFQMNKSHYNQQSFYLLQVTIKQYCSKVWLIMKRYSQCISLSCSYSTKAYPRGLLLLMFCTIRIWKVESQVSCWTSPITQYSWNEIESDLKVTPWSKQSSKIASHSHRANKTI